MVNSVKCLCKVDEDYRGIFSSIHIQVLIIGTFK